MKKTQLTDTFRNIRKELVSFLSIIIIALLAVSSYLGINYSAAALRNCADHFFRQHHFRDIEIVSTMYLSNDDLLAFKNTEGVAEVEAVYSVSGSVMKDNVNTNVDVVSLTEKLNTVELLEGRLPENTNECVLEEELLSSLSLSVGDHITVTDSTGNVTSFLKNTDYLITGSVIHPNHYAYNEYVNGPRYILVNKDVFDLENLDGCFMKAEIKAEGADAYSLFSKQYDDIIQELKKKLKPLNEKLEKAREESVRSSMQNKIDEGEQKLQDAKKELDDGRKKLDENTQKLKDGEKELASAKAQLDDGWVQLQNGEAEAANYSQQLNEAKAQLDEAKVQLDAGKAKLDEAKAQLDAAKEVLDKSWQALEEGRIKLEEANAQLTEAYNEAQAKKTEILDILKDCVTAIIGEKAASKIPWAENAPVSDVNDPNLSISEFKILTNFTIDLSIPVRERVENAIRIALTIIGQEDKYEEVINKIESSDVFIIIDDAYNQIIEKLQQWTDGHNQYIEGRNTYLEKLGEYEEGLAKYNEGLAQYNEGLAVFNEKQAQYDQGLAQYNEGLALYSQGRALLDEKTAEYYSGLAEYNNGIAKLEEGRKELEKAENKYAEGTEEYEKGVKDLNTAKDRLNNLSHCYYVMLDKKGNGGVMHAEESAKNIGKVGITFAFIFVLVGALVIYVTIGRIIGEQRSLVGTQKALGFFNREILFKYILFGSSATLIGILAGTAVAYFGIEYIILSIYKSFYVVDSIPRAFTPLLFIIVLAAGIILSAAAVVWACASLMRQTAKELMQYELPKGKKKTAGSSSSKGAGLYSHLIFRNITTDWRRVLITTISIAGCCLLLVIGFHLRSSIEKALDVQFEEITEFKQEIHFQSGESSDTEEEIASVLRDHGISSVGLYRDYYNYDNNGELVMAKLYCSDPAAIEMGFLLEPAYENETLTFSDHGVLIPQKVAESCGLKAGDTMTIYDQDMSPHEVEISGVFYHYFGHNLFMSREAYQNTFGRAPEDNTLWTSSDLDKKAMDDMLKDIDGYTGVTIKSDTKKQYTSLTKVLSVITLVLIVAAGMMAFFVLLNLVIMYLNKKKRELVTMRINGFTTKEVLRYVSMESVVTSIVGTLFGLVLGTVLANIITRILEQGSFLFYHGIILTSWLFSALITLVFSLVVNIIALRKVKTLKLNDIDK